MDASAAGGLIRAKQGDAGGRGRVAMVDKGPTPYHPQAVEKLEENAGEILGGMAAVLLG